MSQESSAPQTSVLPIPIAESYLQGRGLTKGDPSEFDGEGIDHGDEEPAGFSTYNFHTGKILVSVYEAGPGKVYIEGSVYDEFIQVLEGRLILTPDSGGEYEYKAGDSLVLPRGYKGYWHMPEKYRELIVIDTSYMEEAEDS